MLKQGVVQEALTELNGSGAVLPPLHNLPHWSRVNNLDKSRYPKPFLKDRLQPLPNPSELDGMIAVTTQPVELDAGAMAVVEASVEPASRGVNPTQRVVHLERSIHFLQQQHYEVLTHLHDEIDDLKQQNKELQFQIVMTENPSHPGSSDSRAGSSKHRHSSKGARDKIQHVPHPPSASRHKTQPQQSGTDEDMKFLFLEEEIKELKHALREEQTRNQYLQQMLENAQKQAHRSSGGARELKSHSAKDAVSVPDSSVSTQPAASAPNLDGPRSSAHGSRLDGPRSSAHGSRLGSKPKPTPPRSANMVIEPLPFKASVNPLRIHTTDGLSRVPTVEESELIISHLQKLNDNQAHELNRLKSDLRDVLYSHKWTPDAYLLAKAYVAEDDARENAEQSRLPRIALKHGTRKLPEVAYLQKDAVSLPALRHTLGNKAVERRKRTQILHKSRYSSNKEVTNRE